MKFKNQLKKLECYFFIVISSLYLFFFIFNTVVEMYSWAIYCGIAFFVSLTFCFISLALSVKSSTIMIAIVFTLASLLNILFFWDIFPINYLWFFILIVYFGINYKIQYLFFYIFILVAYMYRINDFSMYMRTKMKIDYYVPTNDVLLVNNTFHIIAMCLISVIMFYFFKEKRKLKVKNWEDFINEEERLIKIRNVEFMIDSQQSSVFENKLDELFFKMKSFLENNKPYKNPNYSISDISKALNEKDIKIIQAITYHNDKIKFKDLLNYYRIKEAKKLLLANESIFEQMYSNVGFKNHAKFCEIFTYFEGMSPEEFMIKNYSAMV